MCRPKPSEPDTTISRMDFTLTAANSWDFAQLSGDFNPLHVDPVAARRLQFGGTVCHGMHQVLKALDVAVAAGQLAPANIDTLAAVFGAPLHTGSTVSVLVSNETPPQRARLSLSTEGRPLFTLKLGLADGLPASPAPHASEPEPSSAPLCPAFPQADALAGLADSVPLQLNLALAQSLFPALALAPQGLQCIADLVATTRIVGMRCPGQHSIYAELKLRRRPAPALTGAPAGHTMPYQVQRCDPRFRSVRLAVSGAMLAGSLDAFFRAPPVAQPDLADLMQQIPAERFAGQHAMVVGGSRGLGELVAKILLAGGARVTLTYARGQADAERIQQQARASGRDVQILSLDASAPLPQAVKTRLAAAAFSHVYHFATPQISKSPAGSWSPALFDSFCQLYLHGFAEIVRAAAPNSDGARALQVLYPSTVFLDAPPRGFAEYCAAKAAGEALCEHLALEPGIQIHKPRLPRLQTDQNSSFLGVEGDAPLPLMLALLQTLQPDAAAKDTA